jgi:hypothetical protein
MADKKKRTAFDAEEQPTIVVSPRGAVGRSAKDQAHTRAVLSQLEAEAARQKIAPKGKGGSRVPPRAAPRSKGKK